MQEIVQKRGRNSKTFDLGGGRRRLQVGNHSHTLKNGLWIPTDTSIVEESGTDPDTGMQYIAKSRAEFLDYDIKFGKNDPVWMKIKHIPSGNKVTFKPKKGNNKPDHLVSGNKITVSQAWDGIDMEIYVTDSGTKTNYIITSAAGQRLVEFTVTGDVAFFTTTPPSYQGAEKPFIVNVPTSFSGTSLTYDFRDVPVGTTIDPTVSVASDAGPNWIESINASWATARGATSGTYKTHATQYVLYAEYYPAGSSYYLYRSFLDFDTTSVEGTVTDANVYLYFGTYLQAVGSIHALKGTQALPPTDADFDSYTGGSLGSMETSVIAGWGIAYPIALDVSGITVEGRTKLCITGTADVENTAPGSTGLLAYFVQPYLDVEYSTAAQKHYFLPFGGPTIY